MENVCFKNYIAFRLSFFLFFSKSVGFKTSDVPVHGWNANNTLLHLNHEEM